MSLENNLNKLIILNVRKLQKGFRWKSAEIQFIPEDNLIQTLQFCISLYLICNFFKLSSLETESLEYYCLYCLTRNSVKVGKTKTSALSISCSEFLSMLMWLICSAEQCALSGLEKAQDQGLKGRRYVGSKN